jgi:pimeloyl-ACP methyl ester carboxylesterase
MPPTSVESRSFTATDFHRERRFAGTPFGRIAYVERGRGPAALFVHGALLNGYQWRHQLAGLADQRRVVALDTLGMGYTEPRPGQVLALKDQAAMLQSFLDVLGIEQVDLVGSDSGGGAAQIFAANHPGRIRTLTLTNSEVDDYDEEVPAAMQFRQLVVSGALVEMLRKAAEDPAFGKMFLSSAYQDAASLPDEAVATYAAPLVQSPARIEQMLGYLKQTTKRDLIEAGPKLRALPAPVLLLWGTADGFFPVQLAYWLRDNLRNVVELVELEGAPVFWPEERPELLNRKLREFWSATATHE